MESCRWKIDKMDEVEFRDGIEDSFLKICVYDMSCLNQFDAPEMGQTDSLLGQVEFLLKGSLHILINR